MIKRFAFVVLAAAVFINLAGCAKKEAPPEELQEQMSLDASGNIIPVTPIAPEIKSGAPKAETARQVALPPAVNLEPLPPAGSYKPTALEIQTALANAGFYTGALDGKAGPLTKKAITDFQKAKGLQADGKVGPKTWEALTRHLEPAPAKTGKR